VTAPTSPTTTPVRLFVGYRVVSRLYFHLSVLYVILLTWDHGPLAIAAVLAAYGATLSVVGPLTGRWVRTRGAGWSLVVGESLKAAGLLLMAVGGHLLAVALLAQVLNGAGFGLAITADPVAARSVVGGDVAAMGQLQSSTQSLMFLSVLVSGVAGGFAFLVSERVPLLAGAAAAAAAAGIAALLGRHLASPGAATSAPATAGSGATGGAAGGTAGSTVAGAATERFRLLPVERTWVTYYVLTRGFMLGAFVGLLPYQLYRVVEVSVQGLALVLAAFSLAAFVAARYVNAGLTRWGERPLAVGTVVVLLAAFATFALTTSLWASTVAMALMGAASGGVRPAAIARLSAVARDHRGGAIPGTVIGGMERAFGICNAAVILVGGVLIALADVRTALLACCVAYLGAHTVSAALTRWSAGTGVPANAVAGASATR